MHTEENSRPASLKRTTEQNNLLRVLTGSREYQVQVDRFKRLRMGDLRDTLKALSASRLLYLLDARDVWDTSKRTASPLLEYFAIY